jgi:predicted small secreted protein
MKKRVLLVAMVVLSTVTLPGCAALSGLGGTKDTVCTFADLLCKGIETTPPAEVEAMVDRARAERAAHGIDR